MKHSFFFHNVCKQGSLDIRTIQRITQNVCSLQHRTLLLITLRHIIAYKIGYTVYFTLLEMQKKSAVEIIYS